MKTIIALLFVLISCLMASAQTDTSQTEQRLEPTRRQQSKRDSLETAKAMKAVDDLLLKLKQQQDPNYKKNKKVKQEVYIYQEAQPKQDIDWSKHVERQKQDYKMKKFDLAYFEKNKRGVFCEIETDSAYILLGDRDEQTYGERIEDNQKLFETHYTYWKSNLQVRSIAYKIAGCDVGVTRFYDQQGNVTKKINKDKDFKYSIYDVGDYILRHEDVDIFKRSPIDWKNRNASVHRVSGGSTIYPYYQINFTTKDDKDGFYYMDGTTGEVLYKKIDGKILINKPDPNKVEKERRQEAANQLSQNTNP